MGAPRFVVTGPPNSGKTTWTRAHAYDDDLVWDFDILAAAMTRDGQDKPRTTDGSRGQWPWPTMKALLTMRDALVAWLARTELDYARVFLIVTDPTDARRIAMQIRAELVDITRAVWEPDAPRPAPAAPPLTQELRRNTAGPATRDHGATPRQRQPMRLSPWQTWTDTHKIIAVLVGNLLLALFLLLASVTSYCGY